VKATFVAQPAIVKGSVSAPKGATVPFELEDVQCGAKGVDDVVHNQLDEGHIRGTTGDCERKHTRRSAQSIR
jgi:hypothetical protein